MTSDRVRASQTLLTIGQFCDPRGHFKWYQSIKIVTKSTHLNE